MFACCKHVFVMMEPRTCPGLKRLENDLNQQAADIMNHVLLYNLNNTLFTNSKRRENPLKQELLANYFLITNPANTINLESCF